MILTGKSEKGKTMMKSPKSLILLLLVTLSLAGCAINRSVLTIPEPEKSTTAEPKYAREVVLKTVTDERVFVAKPKKPSEPSVGFGGAQEADPELVARVVARKINGYGMIMGDVRLTDTQTVASVVESYTREALTGMGVKVVQSSEANPDALILEVHITEFWTWTKIGLITIKQLCTVSGDIAIGGIDDPVTITGQSKVVSITVFDSTIRKAITRALVDYQVKLRLAAADFPLE
jgi:hypothetical protein